MVSVATLANVEPELAACGAALGDVAEINAALPRCALAYGAATTTQR